MTQLTAQDIANALQIIDLAAQRGTFRGAELSSIGMVRDKLEQVLRPPEEQAAQAPQGELNFDTEAGTVSEKIEDAESEEKDAVAEKKQTSKGKA